MNSYKSYICLIIDSGCREIYFEKMLEKVWDIIGADYEHNGEEIFEQLVADYLGIGINGRL